LKERTQDSVLRDELRADGVANGVMEKSPEARGLSQTKRDPARRKRNASQKTKDRCSAPDRQAGANGQAGESSSLTEPGNGQKANGKRNGREISGESKAASDDASGTTFAGDAAPPSAAACTGRDACAGVAAPRSDAATDEASGADDDRRPRAPGDSESDSVVEDDETEEVASRVSTGIGSPLALDAPGFVDEMHARANLYEIGKEFLQTADLKLKQRTWEYLLEMKYGKGAAIPMEETPRIDFGDLPRPKR
jgi:hypothetical protein